MSEAVKRIRIIAGPNGSGKSTLFNLVQNKVETGPYINADNINKLFKEKKVVNLLNTFGISTNEESFQKYMIGPGESWRKKAVAESHSLTIQFSDNNLLTQITPALGYDSALAADFIRYELLQLNASFTFETVLSHPSKLNFLHSAYESGYRIYLYFVSTVSPEINITRIAQRVQLGGHDVPPEKVRNRYDLSLNLLAELARMAHRSYVFDNSVENSEIKLFAEITDKSQILIPDENLPWWVVERLLKPLFSSHEIQVTQ